MFHGTFVQPRQRRRRGLWTSLALLKWVAAHMTDRRDDEQERSTYDAKFNVAEIGAVNMGDIAAVRKRCRQETGPHDSSPCVARVKILVHIIDCVN